MIYFPFVIQRPLGSPPGGCGMAKRLEQGALAVISQHTRVHSSWPEIAAKANPVLKRLYDLTCVSGDTLKCG